MFTRSPVSCKTGSEVVTMLLVVTMVTMTSDTLTQGGHSTFEWQVYWLIQQPQKLLVKLISKIILMKPFKYIKVSVKAVQ